MALTVQSQVEPKVRKSLAVTDQLRLAVVHKGDAYGVGLATLLFDQIIFNGKSAGANGANYRAIDYGDPTNPTHSDPAAGYARAVDSVLGFEPHVLMIAGSDE